MFGLILFPSSPPRVLDLLFSLFLLLPFPELEEQVRQQLSNLFMPPPKLLKDLISRGYIQRDESDHYVA